MALSGVTFSGWMVGFAPELPYCNKISKKSGIKKSRSPVWHRPMTIKFNREEAKS
jgi:hypothetical protein